MINVNEYWITRIWEYRLPLSRSELNSVRGFCEASKDHSGSINDEYFLSVYLSISFQVMPCNMDLLTDIFIFCKQIPFPCRTEARTFVKTKNEVPFHK